jgi:hypothetical protein
VPVAAGVKGIGFSVPVFPFLRRREQLAWLREFRALGITWIRIDISWSVVQPTPARSYHWALYDRAVAEADAAGVHVDAQADYSTPWASVRGCQAADDKCQPASPELFATYAAAIARHFGSGISAEEIWNEPNNVQFWHPAPDPAFYARMLKDSYTAIKAVDPRVIVVSGGLAPETDHGTDVSALTFLSDLYRDGAKGYFDALGYHPYSFPALPDQYEPWSAWSQMGQTRPSIRSIMAAYGDAATPIWITEVGAPTDGDGATATCTSAPPPLRRSGHDDQCLQAREVAEVVRNEKTMSWLGPAFIYTFQDQQASRDGPREYFGIRTAAGAAKASYTALRQAIAATGSPKG